MNNKERIETSTAEYYIEDGIMHVIFKQDSDIDLDASKEGIEARKKLQKGNPSLTFVDMSKAWQVTDEARRYSAEEEVDEMNIAMAVLTGSSFAINAVANFFTKINKPKTPTKIFNSKEKAIEWLKTFK